MTKISEKGLLATKVGMTRVIDAEGRFIPVTLLQVANQKVTKILTIERDGYNGFQVGYFLKKEKNLNKPDIARLRKSGIEENFARFQEFRTVGPVTALKVGDVLDLNLFAQDTVLDITGITKGRGFQGAIKRWNSARGRMTHGSMYHRRTGSLGSNTSPGRVFKNKHMPGHMGDAQKTIKNLQVVKVDVGTGVIAVRGSVPGHRDGFVAIRTTK